MDSSLWTWEFKRNREIQACREIQAGSMKKRFPHMPISCDACLQHVDGRLCADASHGPATFNFHSIVNPWYFALETANSK